MAGRGAGAGVGVGEAGERRGEDGERGRQRRRGVEERVAEGEDRVLGRGSAEEETGERPRREAARPGLDWRRDVVARETGALDRSGSPGRNWMRE